jgi:hypothetical protein
MKWPAVCGPFVVIGCLHHPATARVRLPGHYRASFVEVFPDQPNGAA